MKIGCYEVAYPLAEFMLDICGDFCPNVRKYLGTMADVTLDSKKVSSHRLTNNRQWAECVLHVYMI